MAITGSKRIAERYVKALFDAAQDVHALPQVEKDLTALGEVLTQSAELQQFLSNPLLSRDAQASAMEAITVRLKTHPLTAQFITMLAQQKRLTVLTDIIAIFSQWAQEARGEMKAEVVASGKLSAKDMKALAEKIGKAYGKKINLQVLEDPSLLGGVIVKVGSLQLDSSLSGKIRRLSLALKAA